MGLQLAEKRPAILESPSGTGAEIVLLLTHQGVEFVRDCGRAQAGPTMHPRGSRTIVVGICLLASISCNAADVTTRRNDLAPTGVNTQLARTPDWRANLHA
jgi:hypothetical protein